MVSGDLALHEFLRVGVRGDAMGGKEVEEQVFASAGDAAERAYFVTEIFRVALGDGERFVGEFDLDEVDGVVRAVEQEVNLGALRPGLVGAMHPAVGVRAEDTDPQSIADLGQMLERKFKMYDT